MKAILFALFLLKTTLFCADWKPVSAIAAGTKVRVETAAMKQTGTLVSVSEESIQITTDKGEVSIARADVERVYISTKGHRVRNTIIGTVIGVAAGVTLYSTLGVLFRNEGQEGSGAMLAIPIGIGTAVGAALPTGRMKKIYDVK
jgi:hypothetical protein